MNFAKILMGAAVLATVGLAPSAHAEGLGAEANYGRADGHWGAEVGAGYAMGVGGFSLTPGAGVYLRDGGTRLYGRVEAAYTLPASATIGIGARFSSDNTRPYATLAMPLIPKLRIKGNVGPKYYAVGLTLGY
ncbi:hypothetical protein FHS51_001891 [Sphingobium wenxiniae]|uniref:Outer membrane protein beta-barrel domain-containing protein n=2 Tax=Sphingobium TaxID=165695 RepID=T0GM54_9SPHN|nr:MULTISPECIES: hypothetical protein [Sphingobium]EQB01752.1 hypothetical protein L485_10055 [Sphingobium baderi LL03]KMS62350.1 hypothetical protein V475_08415 [Sphingobium baderi LL03]MBB6191663.1 hypothetical protein [Sphingobium wenxiniae]TWH92738.1 hypothetical protein IQ35_02397 [Sphingobium wenxiniae]WRD76498.1 hypothetical protein QQ987_17430 [Sphingobium baderi]